MLFWKSQGKVQEHRRLQKPGYNVSPQDRPVERVQLTCVVEGIQYKRGHAENVEVRGARSRPAAEKNVKPNREINQSDKTKPVVGTSLRGLEDSRRVQGVLAALQRVGGFRPDAVTV